MTVTARQLAEYLLRHPNYEVLIPTKSGVYYPVTSATVGSGVFYLVGYTGR